jgi:prepilin-type N-terminal cleavage/methylation domain-containing protein
VSRQQGFTLLEVMVSLAISTLLVSVILAIWGRMSIAYRGQHTVAELQQILSAGHARIELDLRQAGFQLPDGFFQAGDERLHQPVEIIDDADGFGPDLLRVFAADGGTMARVVDFNDLDDTAAAAFTTMTVDTTADFAAGDVVVIVKAQDGLPQDVAFYPCVVQSASLTATRLTLATTPPRGTPNHDHCAEVRPNGALGPDRRALG